MITVTSKAKTAYGQNYELYGRDDVHPVANGHLLMAAPILPALGCEGEVGRATVKPVRHRITICKTYNL